MPLITGQLLFLLTHQQAGQKRPAEVFLTPKEVNYLWSESRQIGLVHHPLQDDVEEFHDLADLLIDNALLLP
jgi:hypothetical protein